MLTAKMPDDAEFDYLVRDALANLYDFASLEAHPLAQALALAHPLPAGDERPSRADRLCALLLEAIEQLRPVDGLPTGGLLAGNTPAVAPATWRPYLILQGRYVEKRGFEELAKQLALGDRQLRREQSRALQAVATFVRDSLAAGFIPTGGRPELPSDADAPGAQAPAYVITRER